MFGVFLLTGFTAGVSVMHICQANESLWHVHPHEYFGSHTTNHTYTSSSSKKSPFSTYKASFWLDLDISVGDQHDFYFFLPDSSRYGNGQMCIFPCFQILSPSKTVSIGGTNTFIYSSLQHWRSLFLFLITAVLWRSSAGTFVAASLWSHWRLSPQVPLMSPRSRPSAGNMDGWVIKQTRTHRNTH